MKISCIIVDDEPLALDILEDYVRRTPSLELEGRFSNASDALNLLSAQGGDGGHGIDLAFLDIQMPGMNGLDLAKAIGEGTRVIFTTAFPQYALEGFRVDALDYLLKPINFAEFTRAVDKAAEWFEIKRAAESASNNAPAGVSAPQTLIVKSDYKQFVIPIDTIVYIEGIRDYIRIHLTDGSSVQTLMNMKRAEELLPASHFSRVHRSYIVNLDRVKRIERAGIVFEVPFLSEPVFVPISDTYKEAFLKVLSARSL